MLFRSGLGWPERLDAGVEPLDLFTIGRLEFEVPDMQSFPCLSLAMAAARAGGNAPIILNAANEVAVQAFLEERLPFIAISEVVDQVLQSVASLEIDSIEAVLECDRLARIAATQATAAAAGRAA